MASIFDQITTFQEAESLVPVDDLYLVAKAYYDRDHWQDGDGWTGPIPDPDFQDQGKTVETIRERGQLTLTPPAASSTSVRTVTTGCVDCWCGWRIG